MGVDYWVCSKCGRTFPDCGSYVGCEDCGTVWCSYDCAYEDGYVEGGCKLELDMDDEEEKNKNEQCPKECCCIEYYINDSCGYCREEIFDDETLFNFALSMLDLSREELTEKYKEESK